jgi:hypothetical protein
MEAKQSERLKDRFALIRQWGLDFSNASYVCITIVCSGSFQVTVLRFGILSLVCPHEPVERFD